MGPVEAGTGPAGPSGGCTCSHGIWRHGGTRDGFEKKRLNLCGWCDLEDILPARTFPQACGKQVMLSLLNDLELFSSKASLLLLACAHCCLRAVISSLSTSRLWTNPCAFAGPQFPHPKVLGWLIPKGSPKPLCTGILGLLEGGGVAFYSWTHTGDEKKGDSEGEELPLISLGSLDQERRPMRALLLHLVLCISLAGGSRAENWGWMGTVDPA